MFYKVTARFKPDTAQEFLSQLTDGTITAQEPDGKEIVAAMKRAVVGENGLVHWTEKCYCPTPLQHERETVYDQYFVDLKTEETDGYIEMTGDPFWRLLERTANGDTQP